MQARGSTADAVLIRQLAVGEIALGVDAQQLLLESLGFEGEPIRQLQSRLAAELLCARFGSILLANAEIAVLPAAIKQPIARLAMLFPLGQPGVAAADVAAWRDAGFKDVREGYLTIRMEFKDFADYWTPVTGKDGPLAAYVNSLAADTRERFKAALNAAYCGGETDGPRSFAASAWAVRGIASS